MRKSNRPRANLSAFSEVEIEYEFYGWVGFSRMGFALYPSSRPHRRSIFPANRKPFSFTRKTQGHYIAIKLHEP
jgi:hypothetical protein